MTVAVALALVATGRPLLADGPLPRITVRVYDSERALVSSWPAVTRQVGETLAAAGVELEWRRCDSAAIDGSECAEPFRREEIAVRLITLRGPVRPSGRLPLGYALIDGQTHSGSLATIYLDRVHWLAHEAESDAGVLLARAIAHEIGHLLRGSNEHSRSGLMRAVWDRETLHRGHAADWVFTTDDAATMRKAIGDRQRLLLAANAMWGAP